MAESVGAIIKQWLRENDLEGKFRESAVPGYWTEIVGETVASHSEVERIDKGRMFLRVDNATWRNELMLRREEIRESVNKRFGAEVVKEIIVR